MYSNIQTHMLAVVGLIFFSGGSITKIIFSAGSVSTNGTSINSNAGRFADLVNFCETII